MRDKPKTRTATIIKAVEIETKILIALRINPNLVPALNALIGSVV